MLEIFISFILGALFGIFTISLMNIASAEDRRREREGSDND